MNPHFTAHTAPSAHDLTTRIPIDFLQNEPTDQAAHMGVAVSQGNDLPTDRIDFASSPYASAHYHSDTLENSDQAYLDARDKDLAILSDYVKSINSHDQRYGAKSFCKYLHARRRFLKDATPHDLGAWSLLPNSQGNLPDYAAFTSAKSLCDAAAEAGLLSEEMHEEIRGCSPWQLLPESLHVVLTRPDMTDEQKEAHILHHYQSHDRDCRHRGGAKHFLTYLHSQHRTLIKLSKDDTTAEYLEQWSRMPLTAGSRRRELPNQRALRGAERLCTLATEATHLALPVTTSSFIDAIAAFFITRRIPNRDSLPTVLFSRLLSQNGKTPALVSNIDLPQSVLSKPPFRMGGSMPPKNSQYIIRSRRLCSPGWIMI